MTRFVFTLLGADRPGLVDRFAATVAEHGANWERSHLARLGGRFAGIVEVSAPDPGVPELARALATLGRELDLHVTTDRTADAADPGGSDAATPPIPVTGSGDHQVVISLVGNDRPGLVHAVAAAIAEAGANIEELASATTAAPMSGDPLFEATVTVTCPTAVTTATVRDRLEALADRLMVDIDVS